MRPRRRPLGTGTGGSGPARDLPSARPQLHQLVRAPVCRLAYGRKIVRGFKFADLADAAGLGPKEIQPVVNHKLPRSQEANDRPDEFIPALTRACDALPRKAP